MWILIISLLILVALAVGIYFAVAKGKENYDCKRNLDPSNPYINSSYDWSTWCKQNQASCPDPWCAKCDDGDTSVKCTGASNKYSCGDDYTCTVDPNGKYSSMSDCQAACVAPVSKKYSCGDDYTCAEDPNGKYSSMSDCQSACVAPSSNKYSCGDDYTCTVDPNGKYSSMSDCQSACVAPASKMYSCGDDYTCAEDPNGKYSSMDSCQTACVAPPPDPCDGVTCPSGQTCVNGSCVAGVSPTDVYNFMGNIPKTLDFSAIDSTTKIPQCWDTNYTESDALLRYFINWKTGLTSFRNCVDSSISSVDCSDPTFDLNPAYKWEGFQNAVFIWNTAIQRMAEICSGEGAKCDYNLGNTFAMEADPNLRKMTIAAFLANAVIESAYFMVCKESTQLNDADNTPCPGSKDDGTFNMRYCNNCDNGNPATYSCFGSGAQATAGVQYQYNNSKHRGYATMQQLSQADAEDPKHTACNTGSWLNAPCTDTGATDGLFVPSGCTAKVDPMNTNSGFKTDLCMSLWNLDDSDVNCTDWGGFKMDRQQNCYFGRGLIQLTWSGNYGQVQNWIDIVSQVFNYSDNWLKQQPKIIQDFAKNSANICMTPDLLCGNSTFTDNGKTVVYSDSDVDNVMPWLTSLIYWSNHVSPNWRKNYDFYTSMEGIAPSGSSGYDIVGDVTTGTAPGRLDAYRIMLKLMGVDPDSYQCMTNDEGKVFGCCTFKDDCKGGGGATGSWCVPDSADVSGTSSPWMVADSSQCIPCEMDDSGTSTNCPDGYSKAPYCASQLNVGDWNTFCS